MSQLGFFIEHGARFSDFPCSRGVVPSSCMSCILRHAFVEKCEGFEACGTVRGRNSSAARDEDTDASIGLGWHLYIFIHCPEMFVFAHEPAGVRMIRCTRLVCRIRQK